MTPVELTGNDYVSIPSIAQDGAVATVNVIHGALAGLVEWAGDGPGAPLLQPDVIVDGARVSLSAASWRRLDRWIPTFQLTLAEGLALTGTICAPGGYPAARGFFIRFEFDNRGRAARQISLRMRVAWQRTDLWIATGRPLDGSNRLVVSADCLCLEAASGRGPVLALTGSAAPVISGGSDAANTSVMLPGTVIDVANGLTLYASLEQSLTVQPQRRGTLCCYAGAGRERDGATHAALALRRAGPDHWLRQARFELSHMVRAGEDPQRSELMNRNLLFNRYYAAGRAIDNDRLYLLRSRSTHCPLPAVFNEREALLWTVPALMLADPGLAREAIFRVYDMFSERSGEHRRYIDGGALDSALVLDQLLLYTWIADHYVRVTGDESLLDEPLLRQLIFEADNALFVRLHPQWMLCSTDLLPSGDPVDHPYPTTGNVLVWVFCDALSRLWSRTADEPPLRFEGAASEVAAAIWQHCTTDVDGVAVLASSTNLEGEAAVYDDPSLSLALLPFFGFCPTDDPLWHDTIEFLRSKRYPLWREAAVAGLAARSDPAHGRVSALCADLLGPSVDEALRRLNSITFPGGVAAGGYTFDGTAVIEPFHAALAGFIAWTMPRSKERPSGNRAERRSKQRTT